MAKSFVSPFQRVSRHLEMYIVTINYEWKIEKQDQDTTKDGNICLTSHIGDIKLDELPTQLEQRLENSVESYHCNESSKYFANKRHLVRHHKAPTG